MAPSAQDRAHRIMAQLTGAGMTLKQVNKQDTKAKQDSVTVIDNRSGKEFEIPIYEGTLKGDVFWKQAKLRLYDPGFTNTASAKSCITYIDGPKGILLYRGYPIEQLAQKSTFLEVAYLLIHGELPTKKKAAYFDNRVMNHTYIHEDLKNMMTALRYDSHPMGMIISIISAMSTFHPEANPALTSQGVYKDKVFRNKQIHRMIGVMPTIAAFAYRRRTGRPYVDPSNPSLNLGYAGNFLYMLDKMSEENYRPHPVLVRAIDILFILHADHELNCSTAGMRHTASSGVDVYTAVAAATASLYGPRHGGANEAVLNMLSSIGKVENVPAFVDKVKKREVKLMGFGHRVYKNYDPRARIIKKIADDVFKLLGTEPLIEVAVALEKHALSDPYFIERKLYPNVDFYSGLIYKAMGFPPDFFTVLFAIPRTVGWIAHWSEFLDDKENRIVRPRQIYLGHKSRDYVPLSNRAEADSGAINSNYSANSIRRTVSNSAQ